MRNIAALLSMLMPGSGQFYNQQYIKGFAFFFIEHWLNIHAKINQAIFLDFNSYHKEALETAEFSVLLFYPGFYTYVVWDAWYYAHKGADKTATIIPFLIGGFLGEFGSIFAGKIPFPTLSIGLLMIIPMLIAMILFRKQ